MTDTTVHVAMFQVSLVAALAVGIDGGINDSSL